MDSAASGERVNSPVTRNRFWTQANVLSLSRAALTFPALWLICEKNEKLKILNLKNNGVGTKPDFSVAKLASRARTIMLSIFPAPPGTGSPTTTTAMRPLLVE